MHVQVDIERIRARVREASKLVFGAQYRAEVAAFIGIGSAPFWARGMAKPLDIPENKVAAELARFADTGMLVAMPVEAWDRRRLYESTRDGEQYWHAAHDLVRRAAREEALRVDVDENTAMEAYLTAVHGASHWSQTEEES